MEKCECYLGGLKEKVGEMVIDKCVRFSEEGEMEQDNSLNLLEKEELKFVKKWLDKRNFYAVGEIGIDLYWDTFFLKQQQIAFKTQIQWAKEKGLPIVIHCRDAFDEIFAVLET